jgi:AbiV family abortive infection protein
VSDTAREIMERARAILEGNPGAFDPQEFGESLLAALTEDEQRGVAERFKTKEVARRFPEFTDVLLGLVNGTKRLVTGETLETRVDQYMLFVAHARSLWHDARNMFERERFGTAVFLAIACMEEVGKGGVAKLQVLLWPPRNSATTETAKKGRGALYSHAKKHLLVAGQGALINARLDRLLGLDRVAAFLDDVDDGRIEEIRQSALYADHDGTNPLIPEIRFTRDEALFYVTLAGEMMAEILGAVPEVWRELLDEAIAFEKQQGIALSED